ncbi:RNF32 [Symbiodinium natans]|uniref:RNF32 protein n=1 Tax=Symbiodinium natans TaxID=878477 RepID=A0A812M4M8_9DINO|nr:RNF32 [Symbiodinium natans]
MRRHRSASPGTAPGVVTTGARGEVWRAVALQAHLLGKDARPQARSASARRRQDTPQFEAVHTSRSAPCPGPRQAVLDYDEKLKRHEASLTLAQRLGLVAKPAQPLTHEQWEQVKHASDSRQDSEVPCSICLEDFRTRPQVILSCSHVFHGECLRSFERFSGKRYCPLCRCPYFDATIHYSGLMVWRKKCASRIQRAWRGYRSRGELFLQLRQVRTEAPTLHRRFCGKALKALGGKLEKVCEAHEDALDRFLQELDGSVATSSAQIRDGLRDFEQLHLGPGQSVGPLVEDAAQETTQDVASSSSDAQTEGRQRWAAARQSALSRGEEVDCPICFQACDLVGRGSDRVELLSCSHVFHRCCLMSFESFHVFEVHLCPVCRQSYERRPWNHQEGERPPRPPGPRQRPGAAKLTQDPPRGSRPLPRRGASDSRLPDYRVLRAAR